MIIMQKRRPKPVQVIAVLILLTITVFMTSCNDGQHNNEGEQSAADLRIVYDNFGKDTLNAGAFTANGYYYFATRDGVPYDTSNGMYGTANLTYIDYSSAELVYLCNIPGCAHNNSDCPSYIFGGAGPCVLFADYDENRIISLVTGIPGYDVETEEQLGKITSMDLTGTGRSVLYRLESKESFSLEDSIFIDDKAVYLAVITLDEDTNQFVKEIRRVDLETGAVSVLYKAAYGLSMVSCYDKSIVFYNRDDFPRVYSSLDVNTGEIRELYSGQGAVLTSGHYNFYAYNNYDGTGDLIIIDLFDHSKRTISGIPCHPDKGIRVSDLYDGILEWSFVTPEPEEEIKKYFVDLENECFWEKTLTRKPYYGYDITYPLQIFGEAGDDSFLVLLDSYDSEVSFIDYKGIPHIISFPDHPSYGIITKKDYYGNEPNYRYIDDHVFVHKISEKV